VTPLVKSKEEDNKMTPFDLARALAGDPVIERNGAKIIQIAHFNLLSKPCLVTATEGGIYTCYELNGKHYYCEGKDLFMAQIKKIYYVNVYKDEANGILLGNPTSIKNDMTGHCNSFIKTIEIEVENA
jgi:hypothetical protein